jgi:hypothetical protein
MDSFLTHLLAALTAHTVWDMVTRLVRRIKSQRR